MKKQNVLSKRRPRQNILSIILSSAKQKKASSSVSASTPNTAPTSKSAGSSATPRRTKSNKLLSTAVELTRRSKDSRKPRKSILLKGSRAFYRGPKGIEKVTIVGVHHDSKLEPYYTIQFRDGKEKQMDGKRLTPIEEKREERRSSVTSSSAKGTQRSYGSSSEQPTDQCSSSSSEPSDGDDDRFHKGQDAYYRSPSRGGEGVTKIKIVEKIQSSNHTYIVAFSDGSKRQVEGDNLVGLIDLTSKELASLMKEKNERAASTPNLRSSIQSKDDSHDDQGYEPEAEPSSSENSYEDNLIENSPGNSSGSGNSSAEKKILALPCAVEMVEAKTEEGGTRMVPLYKAEMDVYYRGPQGVCVAHIVKSHFDDLLEPYYTIRLEDGREKQTDNAHISLEKPEEEPEDGANGEPGAEGEGDDDWYQEWKESQLRQDDELREQMKQYEEQENGSLSAEKSIKEKPQAIVSEEKSPVSREEPSEHTKEEISEPDTVMSSQIPKNHASHRSSEGSELRTDYPVGTTTPQVKKMDPDASSSALVPAPQFNVGDSVLYNSSKGDHMRATITKVRKDEKNRPYFVIKLSNGDEKKVYGHRLTPMRRESDRDSSRTRRRSRSRARGNVASSMRSTSMDPRRLSRMQSIGSTGSRDSSVDRSRSSSDRRAKLDRSRSMSRPPKEHQPSRGRRAESRDPRGRVHPAESKESRSRSKSVRAASKDYSSKDEGGEHRQRARSRSRAPDDSAPRRATISARKAPMVMGVSHRVQHIGDDEGNRAKSSKSGSTSRFGKLKSSISSGITKAKQRSFDR